MKPREILKILEKDGWYKVRSRGSHVQMKHSTKKGTVTVPIHNTDLKISTLKSILKQAGM